MLALTIVTTTSSNTYSAFPAAAGNNQDGFDAPFDSDFGTGNRETIVTQEIPVRVLAPDTVAHLHEPACREPDVHIILPPLMQLKSISDRFTKLALADTKVNSSTTTTSSARTRLEIAANMHGCLKLSIRSDAMSISSVWTDLNNPELDPGHVAGGEDGIAEHPSTRMKQLGSADGRSDEGWAVVRIDGRDWGKVMSVGRLGGRVIACECDTVVFQSSFVRCSCRVGFCHEHALILYVYLPNDNGEDESVLTASLYRTGFEAQCLFVRSTLSAPTVRNCSSKGCSMYTNYELARCHEKLFILHTKQFTSTLIQHAGYNTESSINLATQPHSPLKSLALDAIRLLRNRPEATRRRWWFSRMVAAIVIADQSVVLPGRGPRT